MSGAEQKLCHPTQQQRVYLSLITEAFSRKIVGHDVHTTLQSEGVARALRMALRSRNGHLLLIQYSDRGIQHCATSYQTLH